MPPHLKNWIHVPHGSKLRAKVEGEVPSSGRWQVEKDGAIANAGELSDSQLRAGWRKTVNRKETVSVVVFLTFTQASEKSAEVRGDLTKPDGSAHGSAFKKGFTGKKGDPEVHVFLSARGASK